ncbi:helix-turn-helix domain-containing protein [Chamaesiphon minutus]|uniref:Putative transcription regulator containing HTH domain n=1 Tax=Chamaesiphon minutus (strain ATCC 27169 / PCC 6605) TaxID=1173020 RepID=K9UMT5_CHAP6|nr:transcription regulator containing HTH domain [Chamaesiphon minutus]AFY95973.1 putative transcription regulator containing HTH domain [Chamaesiphon minutus PCC 6605]
MTLTFDDRTYNNLLAEISPKVIETEAEYDRALAIAERLTFTKNKTPEERAVYRLLVVLIEAYESEHYALPVAKPHEILQHIMEASGTCQSDLVKIVGSSSVVSEIVNGKLAISKAQAKILGDLFKVSPSLFI